MGVIVGIEADCDVGAVVDVDVDTKIGIGVDHGSGWLTGRLC